MIVRLLLCVMAVATFAVHSRAEYYHFEGVGVPSLPAEWIGSSWSSTNVAIDGGQPSVGGVVLKCLDNDELLLTPKIQSPIDCIVDFRVRSTTSATSSLSIYRLSDADGSTNTLGSFLVIGTNWAHYTLIPTNGFSLGSTNRIAVSHSSSSGSGVLIDNLYIGRGMLYDTGGVIRYTCSSSSGLTQMWFRFTDAVVAWSSLANANIGGITTDVFRADTRAGGSAQGSITPYAQLPEVSSGNFVADLTVLNWRGTYGTSRNDRIELIVSTNDWKSSVVVGDAVYRYDTNVADNTWRTSQIRGYVTGISSSRNTRIGLRASAFGNSSDYMYIRGLDIRFMTTVVASNMRYAIWDQSSGTLSNWPNGSWQANYNDSPYVSVDIDKRPPTDVTNLIVQLVQEQSSRSQVMTYTMTNLSSGSSWRTEMPLFALEAGESNRFRVECSFSSVSGAAINSPVLLPGPTTNHWVDTVVSGLGSVWVNELSRDWLELAAPSGRLINVTTGWHVRIVSTSQTQLYPIVITSFSNSVHHGIAFESFRLDPGLVGVFTSGHIAVRNGAGIDEFSSDYVLGADTGLSWSAVGYGAYVSNQDYSAYYTNYEWIVTNETPNGLNIGQYVEVPVTLSMVVSTVVSYARVDAAVGFSSGLKLTNAFSSATGETAPLTLSGIHSDRDFVAGILSGTAFGWRGVATTQSLSLASQFTNKVELSFQPGVGYDDFTGAELAPYWQAVITNGSYSPTWVAASNALRIDTRAKGVGQESWLRVQNSMQSRGKYYATLSLLTRNSMPDTNRIDSIRPALSTSPGVPPTTPIRMPTVFSRYPAYTNDAWVEYRATLGSDQLASGDLFFSLQAVAGGNSGKYMWLDDLNLKYHDYPNVSNLVFSPVVVRAGEKSGLRLELSSGGSYVSNVSPTLCYRVGSNGVWNTYDIAHDLIIYDSTIVTVRVSEAIGPFSAGDTVDYYLKLTYNSCDGGGTTNRDYRYIPDNGLLDTNTEATLVVGPYTNSYYSITVQDIGSAWFNEIQANPEGGLAGHYVEIAGQTSTVADLSNWQLWVENLTNGAVDTYRVSSGSTAWSGATGGYGFFLWGGSGVAGAQQALTNALPAHAGLKLFDAQTNLRYAVSYDASGDDLAAASAAYEYLGQAGGGANVLAATGEGNPANQQFGWIATNTATAGGLNPGQSFANTAPSPDPPTFSSWSVTMTSIQAVATTASDLNPPIQYRLTGPTVTQDWSTDQLSILETNLSENTRYTFTVQTRDAWTNTTALHSSNVYTLVRNPAAPSVTGAATNALTISAYVPNLESDRTGVRFDSQSGLSADTNYYASGAVTVTNAAVIQPNRPYAFLARARNGDGVESDWSANAGTGYSLAATPSQSPLLVQTGSLLKVVLTNLLKNAVENDDGNPTNTQYAVRTWIPGSGVTNYLTVAGAVQAGETWSVLADWLQPGGISASVDKTKTNAFAVMARNGQNVATVLGPAAELAFTFSLSFIAEQTRQLTNDSGTVQVAADVVNPVPSPGTNVCLRLQYTPDAGANWFNATLLSVTAFVGHATLQAFTNESEVYQVRGLDTSGTTNSLSVVWNARADLGTNWDAVARVAWTAFEPGGLAPSAPVTGSVPVDVRRPTVGTLSTTALDPFNTPHMTGTLVFSEVVAGFASNGLTVGSGFVSAFAGSGSNYTFVVTPTVLTGQVSVSVGANVCRDGAGNSNSASALLTRTYDGAFPLVSLTSATPEPFSNATLTATASFNEPVTGFESNDVGVLNGVLAGFTANSATNFSLSVTPSGQGPVTVSIATGVCTDVSGNPNTNSVSLARTFDSVRPGLLSWTTPVPDPFSNSAFTVTAVFTENVSGFTNTDVLVLNGTTSNFQRVSASNYTFVVTPSGQGTVTVSTAAGACADLAGNLSSNGASLSRVYDSVRPGASLGASVLDPFSNSTFTVTAVFTENVSGFTNTDVLVLNGTTSNFQRVSASNYTFVVTPSGQGTVTVSVAAGVCEDAAHNPNTAAASLTPRYDSVRPGITLDTTMPDPFSVSDFLVRADFGEVVTHFALTNITLVNGTAADLSGSGSNYTFTVTPIMEGTVTVSVAAGECFDLAGNPNTATADSLRRRYDPNLPGVTLSSSAPNPFSVSNVTLVVTGAFTEVVTGFASNDVSVSNGVVSSFSGSGDLYTFTIVPTGQGTVTVSVAAGACFDLADNPNLAGDPLVRVHDSIPPVLNLASSTPEPFSISNTPWVVTGLFSEAVSGFVSNDVVVSNGWVSGFSGSDDAYVWTVVPSNQGVVRVSVPMGACVDGAGNSQVNATDLLRTHDSVAPTVALARLGATPTNATELLYRVTFSEAVSGFAVEDVQEQEVGVVGDPAVEGGGLVYTVRVSNVSGDGTYALSVVAGGAHDAAGNPNAPGASTAYTLDQTPPECTITRLDAEPTRSTTLRFGITFTEPVAGFAVGDLVEHEVGVVGLPALSGAGASYTVTVSSVVGDGTYGVSVPAGVCYDQVGNTNSAGSRVDTLVDQTPPVLMLSSGASDPFSNATFSVTAGFSENVVGFALEDVVVSNGTPSGFAPVSASNYTFVVTPAGQGTVTVSVAAGRCTDEAWNSNTAAQLSRRYDSVGPAGIITRLSGSPTNASVLLFQIAFNEPVIGFAVGDVTEHEVGVTGTPVLEGVGPVYTVRVSSVTGNGTYGLSIGTGVCADIAGNLNQALARVDIQVDQAPPVLTLLSPMPTTFSNSTLVVTALINEVTSGFASNDIAVINGNLSAFTANSGSNFALVVSPAGQGTVQVQIAASACVDTAGNGNAATNISRVYDSLGPVVTGLTADPSRALTGWTSIIRFDVSETTPTNPALSVNGNTNVTFVSKTNNAYTYRYRISTADDSGAVTGTPATIVVTARDALGNTTVTSNRTALRVGGREAYQGVVSIPGRIEFEDFDFGGQGVAYWDDDNATNQPSALYRPHEGVDIQSFDGTNIFLSYVRPNEWVEYRVHIEEAGPYLLSLRLSSLTTGGTFRIAVNGTNVTDVLTASMTSNWMTFATMTVSNIVLPVGESSLRVSFLTWGGMANGGFVANFDYADWQSLAVPSNFTLAVDSAYGAPTPSGVTTNLLNTVITSRVERMLATGSTQFVCMGWTLAGHEPATGDTNVFQMIVTNHAALTWLWKTQYYFLATAGTNGSVGGETNGWFDRGSSVTVTAVPQLYYQFTNWTGDVPPAQSGANPLVLTQDQPRSVSALFSAVSVTNGAPQWWLAQYGISPTDTGALADTDRDGKFNWEEWICGTLPNDSNSVLRLQTNRMASTPGARILAWPAVSGRIYTLSWSTNLLTGFPVDMLSVTNDTPRSYTDTVHGAETRGFYQIKVRLP